MVSQLAIPDTESVPLNVNETGWVYQPWASWGLEGLALVIVGGVAS
jgi:hypothetical protein